MKVICDRSALVDALNVVSSVVVARTPKPVLRCVKLEATDGALMVSATDMEVSVVVTVNQIDVAEEGVTVLPADRLSAIVKEWSEPTISIEMEGTTAELKGQDSYFKIYGQDASDFPKISETTDGASLEVGAEVLADLVHKTQFATARENSRYAINGVLFEGDESRLTMVATDGKRLAVATGAPAVGASEAVSVIVPTKALTLITKLFHDPDENVKVKLVDGKVVFGDSSATLTSALVEGHFPPYRDVIPKDQDRKAIFKVDALASGVRRAALLTTDESRSVRLSFNEEMLELASRAPEMGESQIKVENESYTGEPIEIGFNPNFILDALKVVDTDEVSMEFKQPNKPGVMKSGKDFFYVIMPLGLG